VPTVAQPASAARPSPEGSAVSTLPEEVRQAYDTPEQLKEGLPWEPGPSSRPLPPDGWSEPALTVPTKVVTNLVLVLPLTKGC
jgi:hypothetical protein